MDLLLPQYDITYGSNIYDDVLVVEFCIAIANRLESRSAIYVKDQIAWNMVHRILESREQGNTVRENNDNENFDDDDEEEEEEELENEGYDIDDNPALPTTLDTTASNNEAPSTIEFYDDFAEFSGSSVFSSSTANTIPAAAAAAAVEDDDIPTGMVPPNLPKTKITKPTKNTEPSTIALKKYRLASVFGDAIISKGTDMADDILTALRQNARPLPNEDTLIILSSVSREEGIALRSLVASYQSTKTIVLVNCKVDQVPRELSKGETVYSVLPLVAKNVQDNGPNVVVLRTYPGKWQVYVDANDGTMGFQLASEADADNFSKKRGPPMEWITKCVKNFLLSRLG